ncbi:zinc ribbon domain-containing protein [Xanthobacter sp. KR7-65]|uniref:FmdB family zinc ribbon protein n=1 Tax=Xanthobacter sp. KR7-65 TaxID=3156612 RepID=UPI0032B407B0
MPLYTYHCPDCDKEFEQLVSASDTPACPACGSARVEQMVSRIAPEAKLKAVAKAWRAQATKEGHTSNFGSSERKG